MSAAARKNTQAAPVSATAEEDARWMAEALRLARRGEGKTRPNPPVGAVIVRDGRCVGRGWHHKAGGPHAEVYALRQAGDAACGATLYVTLEPCSTFGRTPPCCRAVEAAGIARVVAAITDPNPKHAGRGFTLLRRAGLQVDVGCRAEEARDLLAPFACHMLHGRPFFSLKLGLSIDGRIADATRTSRWITGPDARTEVQAMRRASDAILVGAGTVRHDNPSLWPRPANGRQPWRIIVARRGTLPTDATVFCDEHAGRTLLAVPAGWHPACARRLRAQGVEVLELPKTPARFLPALATELGRRGILRVFCEGGGDLAASLVNARLVDELICFVAPILVGGPVGATGSTTWPLAEAPGFVRVEARSVGRDFLLRYRPVQ